MKFLLLLVPLAAVAQPAPFQDEVLNYSINWPSGLSLGESRMEAKRAGERWELQLSLEAAVPGFAVRDRFRSISGKDLCSVQFEKDFSNGNRKAKERTSFDAEKTVATRETLEGGGKSELRLPACPRDALGFLYHLRRELSQGRLPRSQPVYFGAVYQVRVDYGGSQTLRIGETPTPADRLTANVRGPASEITFEIFFAQDAARTPLLVRVPLAMGTFSMELVR